MRHWMLGGLILGMSFGFMTPTVTNAETQENIKVSQPRLVMVKINHWKVRFFNLPEELPVLISSGETFDPKRRMYDFEESMEAMDVYVRLKPKDPLATPFRLFLEKWPLYQAFFKAVDSDDFEQAKLLIAKIQKLDPKEPAVHFYLGSIYSQAGDYAGAEKEYHQSMELYPDYGPTYINLARLAMARQSKVEAANYLKMAMEKTTDPEQAATHRLAEQMLESLRRR